MTTPETTRAPPHPAVYLVLYLPFGISSGYVTVTLAWLMGHAGAGVEAVAGLTAMNLLPQTWKVLWAPLVDTTLTAKAWFVISILLTGVALAVTGYLPLKLSLMPVLLALVFVISVASTLAAMGAERLMAFDTAEDEKGRAGGWSQAGNLGGNGLGGGAGLWIATHGHPWMAGTALALVSAVCALPLILLHEPGRIRGEAGRYGQALIETVRDCWTLVKTRTGLLAGFILLLPLGTAAALWPSVAKDWGAGADQVALVSGLLSGLVSIPGAIAGGFLADRMDRKGAYAAAGLLSAATAVVMAFGPRTPAAFMVGVTFYNLAIGVCYAAYAAVVLEAIGHGAAATKFNLLASIANMPLLVMTLVDGWAAAHFGAGGMLLAEAGAAVVAVALFYAVALGTRGLSWSPSPAKRGRGTVRRRANGGGGETGL